MKRTITKMMAAFALLAFFIPSMTAWGQTKITDYSNIVSGNTYYIGATTGGTDYYLYVYHDYNSTSTAGTAKTSMNDATTFVFEGSGTSWTIKFDNGKYLSLKDSKDNGKVQVVTDPATFTTSNQSGKIRLSKGSFSVQKNNSGTQFGSYANTQTDIWLMEVPSGMALTTVTIDASGITNTDVYTSTSAGSLSATVTENTNNTVINGAVVTWSSSNTDVATIASDGSVTLVAEGTTTITASYAGVSGEYGESSATYELIVSDSTPFNGGDVTFVAGTDTGSTTTTGADQMTKKVVTISSTSAAFATAEYRLYSGSTTTISTSFGTITRIEFTKNGNYSLGNLSTETGTYSSSTGVWTGDATSVDFSASAQVRLDEIAVTVTVASPVADPTFSPVSGTTFGNEGLSVTISQADNEDIYYTLDGTDPTTSSSLYSGAIALTTTTTIKAIASDGTNTSNVVTATYTYVDPNAPGTVNNPYTVAQARAAIDANTGITDVYATGIISQVDSYSNNTITYWISDDGTTTNQLEVYKGKNLNNTNFTALSDVEVGASVIVFGTLKKYNEIYEFNSGNYLTSYTAPVHAVEAPTFSPVAGTYTTAQTVTLSCATETATIFYTIDGTDPATSSTTQQYANPITVSSTTTIKAVAVMGQYTSNMATATYHFCSATDPYTVTEALAFNEYPANNIYVHGIVSTAPTSNPSSGKLTYYISVNGEATNQLEVYQGKGLNNENFSSKDDIQVGDIVTVYGNVVIYGTSNPIKEFAQGNYLVSFDRPAQQYTLTVTPSANVEIYTFVGDDPTQEGQAGAYTTQVYDGTTVGISVSAEEGYILTLIVDGTDVTSQLDETGWYEFTMPAHNVTVTATASLAPVVTTNTYTLATSIESGKQYIIVGKADSKYYAMGYNKGSNRHAVEITSDGATATAVIDNTETNAHEFTISSLGGGYYSIMDATTSGGYLYAASNSGNQLKTESTLDEYHNGDWKITINAETGVASVVADQSSNRNVMQFNNSSLLFNCYASASQHPVYLYVKVETVTYDLTINGYGSDNTVKNGWNLIASPVSISPEQVENMTNDTYDLYYFDHNQEKEWINYKESEGSSNPGFNLVPGKGYLYANSNTVTLKFSGDLYSGNGEITLPDAGFHLIGNPFYNTVTNIGRAFYRMNSTNNGLIAATENDNVNAWEGIFVEATQANEVVTFEPVSGGNSGSKSVVKVNLSHDNNLIDRAIVRFNDDHQLMKFQLFEDGTKLYIPQDGKDYAIVNAEAQGEMIVSFKAAEDDTYTITVNPENVEMGYLHLFDNKTGANIDLMATPSYSFDAQADDNVNRFRLVFKANNVNEMSAESEAFAFVSNGQIFFTNTYDNATLQIVDMTGRTISTEQVNGNSVNMQLANGVYVLRLINDGNAKIQKIVVK